MGGWSCETVQVLLASSRTTKDTWDPLSNRRVHSKTQREREITSQEGNVLNCVCLSAHVCVCDYLALAQRALGAVFDPGGAAEPRDPVFILAGFGDVIADGVCLARVRDAARAAFALGHQREVAVGRWAGQRPAVHFPLLNNGENISA